MIIEKNFNMDSKSSRARFSFIFFAAYVNTFWKETIKLTEQYWIANKFDCYDD